MEFRKIKFASKEDVEMQEEEKGGCLHDCALWVCKAPGDPLKRAGVCVRYWNSKKTIWF